jgi:hypothetical protein
VQQWGCNSRAVSLVSLVKLVRGGKNHASVEHHSRSHFVHMNHLLTTARYSERGQPSSQAGEAKTEDSVRWAMDGLADVMAVRTKHIDDFVRHAYHHAGIHQLVILGAGLDCRA